MDVEAIKKGIIEAIKGRAKKLYDESKPARDFIEDRAGDVARLIIMLSKVSDEQEEEAIKKEIAIARQAAENEIAGLGLDAEEAFSLKEIIGTIFEMAEKVLPIVIALL